MSKIENITILGSGPAGYTAAIYAARAGLSPLMVSGLEQGGQLMITTDVENYPGFEKPIQGPWLMEQMKNQAKSFGTRILVDFVKDVDLETLPFKLKTEKKLIKSNSIVIATGAKANWLNIKGEHEFMGFGVSACATCDGFFFKGKDVAVVGGGNTAVEEALFLSNLCRKVYIIHRRDRLRAEKILQERLFQKKNVDFIWNSNVTEITGDLEKKELQSIIIKNKNNEINQLSIDGFFVAIGHSPATTLFKNKLQMDNDGYIFTEPNSTKTDIEGVFAAGDVTDRLYRQAVTAAGMGCMSAIEAENFLSLRKII
ncbi:MAG: thioredoxin-disulfide reductase [Rickettsiales bacterium]|nr:thioredoxin-disulfide reductase [Rickettsiales bacterium]RPG15769.1 MAG: thioredoxin-disulfide reductase [Pelagibacteraceae bacterium TMED195]